MKKDDTFFFHVQSILQALRINIRTKKMSISANINHVILMRVILIMGLAASQYCSAQDLQVGFYANKCIVRSGFLGIFSRKYDVERIVADKVRDAYYSSKYRNIVPALLRLQFHDCFVYVSFSSIIPHIHFTRVVT